jgi:hypothetical protein
MPNESRSPVPGAPPPEPAPRETPATLDRSALERVLARAAELQANTAEPGEAMTEAQLLDLGKEVGLSPEHLRQALAEERTRVEPRGEPRGVAGWFGPDVAWTQRTVRGSAADVMATLDRWMQNDECLQVKRRFGDRMTWEARRDLIGNIKRGFNVGGRGYALTRAFEVGATVVPIDDTRLLVRLDADFTPHRRKSVVMAGVSLGAGVAAAGSMLALATAFPGGSLVAAGGVGAVWTLLGVAAGSAIARAQRRVVARAQLALEQLLDRLEHGEATRKPPSFLDVLNSARLLR